MTFVLNVLFGIYFQPVNELVCPQIFSFVNGSLNEDLEYNYVIGTFVLASVYLLLTLWLLLEYFIVTWPHFVLPKFLYNVKRKLEKNRLTASIAK